MLKTRNKNKILIFLFVNFNKVVYNENGDNMKIICIGNITYDITLLVDNFPIENTKNRICNQVECGGGSAANAAYLLGKWDCDVYFLGVVGNDEYGKHVRKELESANVKTKYLEQNSKFKTTTSSIIVNSNTASRTTMTYRPASVKMNLVNLSFTPSLLFMDGQEYEMSLSLLEKYPNAISLIDAGRPTKEIIELSKRVNYLVCSKSFAEEVTQKKICYDNFSSILELYNDLKNQFPQQTIVVTLEEKGCLYEQNNQVQIMPALKVEAKDTTGAGDIFHGAFAYGLVNGMSLPAILKLSNITAGLSVTKIGSKNSIPLKEEVKRIFNEIK